MGTILPRREVRKKMRRLNQKGFTLVEIMIVVAIIVLLAAIAIPNLLRARLNANEAAAISTLRTLSSALESYRAAQTPPAYPGGLAAMTVAGGSNPSYIDDTLAAGVRQGYNFGYGLGATNNEYDIAATPVTPTVTGNRSFSVDESGVVMDTGAGAPVQ